MSIRILLDHGIKQDHIIFVTFLVARGGGISVLRRAFPGVKIVCGAVDDEMKEGWLDVEGYHGEGNPEDHPRKVWVMQPGMGQIGKFSLCHFFHFILIFLDRGSLLYQLVMDSKQELLSTSHEHRFVFFLSFELIGQLAQTLEAQGVASRGHLVDNNNIMSTSIYNRM